MISIAVQVVVSQASRLFSSSSRRLKSDSPARAGRGSPRASMELVSLGQEGVQIGPQTMSCREDLDGWWSGEDGSEGFGHSEPHDIICLKYNQLLDGSEKGISINSHFKAEISKDSKEEYMNPSNQQPANSLKLQYIQQKKSKLDRRMRRKTFCPQHPMQKLIYKCADEDCKQPYICLHAECLEAHFHTPTLKLTRINVAAFEEKFQRTQQAIASSEKFFSQAFQIKAVVDSLKKSVTLLFKDVNGMGKVFADLKADVDSALNSAFINRVQQALSMQNRINGAIEKIRAKINLAPQEKRSTNHKQLFLDQPTGQKPEEEFLMKSEIGSFLQANIVNFSWQNSVTLAKVSFENYSSQEFHESIAGRPNLIFLFVGESMVIGSYFSSPYPKGKGVLNDPTSFIFAVRQEPQLKILKFLANSDSTHHMEVADNFLVLQGQLSIQNKGIKVASDALNTMEISLPTGSFVAENITEDGVNETLKLQQILVLQVGACNA